MKRAVLLCALLTACAPRPVDVPAEMPDTIEARRQIWAQIVAMAPSRRLDPGFVYALVRAESHFDPHAKRGEARGLLQIKPKVWRSTSALPYATSVFEWRTNLAVGMDSLAALKRALEAKGVFSYGVLWAAHHYGYDFVAAHGFDMSRIPRPSDPVSSRLWSGDPHPVPPPK